MICSRRILLLLVAVSSMLYSCRHDPAIMPDTEHFIHISHPYVPYIPEAKVDSLVQKIPLQNYQLVMLGGDITNASSLSLTTMLYIDSIFDVGSKNTLWSIGNHDYDNLGNFTAVTHKPTYYAYYHYGITFLVLDTQDSLSNFRGMQLQLIKNVTDTISESSHLILLTHKLVWMYGNADLEPWIDSTSNGAAGSCFWCLNPNNFYTDVYPMLLNVKQRNINVICVGGDMGYQKQQFNFTTSDGILYLGCGMFSGHAVNKCIVFDYEPETRKLAYSFQLLTDLAKGTVSRLHRTHFR